MIDNARAIIRDLEENPPPLEETEVAEGKALLEWMIADHFTFLGYREYDYEASQESERLEIVQGTGLGLLRNSERRVMNRHSGGPTLSPEVREFLQRPELVIVTKTNFRPVHRPVYLDYIGIKRFDAKGDVVGERRFVGLFTSAAYNRTPREIPTCDARPIRSSRGRVSTAAAMPARRWSMSSTPIRATSCSRSPRMNFTTRRWPFWRCRNARVFACSSVATGSSGSFLPDLHSARPLRFRAAAQVREDTGEGPGGPHFSLLHRSATLRWPGCMSSSVAARMVPGSSTRCWNSGWWRRRRVPGTTPWPRC